MTIFPNLAAEIARHGLKKGNLAKSLDLCNKAFTNRMNGKVSFTWDEAVQLKTQFFPEVDLETLFQKSENNKPPA